MMGEMKWASIGRIRTSCSCSWPYELNQSINETANFYCIASILCIYPRWHHKEEVGLVLWESMQRRKKHLLYLVTQLVLLLSRKFLWGPIYKTLSLSLNLKSLSLSSNLQSLSLSIDNKVLVNCLGLNNLQTVCYVLSREVHNSVTVTVQLGYGTAKNDLLTEYRCQLHFFVKINVIRSLKRVRSSVTMLQLRLKFFTLFSKLWSFSSSSNFMSLSLSSSLKSLITTLDIFDVGAT